MLGYRADEHRLDYETVGTHWEDVAHEAEPASYMAAEAVILSTERWCEIDAVVDLRAAEPLCPAAAARAAGWSELRDPGPGAAG